MDLWRTINDHNNLTSDWLFRYKMSTSGGGTVETGRRGSVTLTVILIYWEQMRRERQHLRLLII